MSIVPVAVALVVSFMSAITLLGVSAENYTYGTHFVVINVSYLLGTPIVCYCFLPVFFKLQATSAYEVGVEIGELLLVSSFNSDYRMDHDI
jgi:sodium-coupled monocarboxylate transporter 8/12